jgi:hypothetical protein
MLLVLVPVEKVQQIVFYGILAPIFPMFLIKKEEDTA